MQPRITSLRNVDELKQVALAHPKSICLGAATAVIAIAYLMYSIFRPLTPLEVVKRIDSVHNVSELPAVQHLCSSQGYELMQWGLNESKDSSTKTPPQYGAVTIHGNQCDVEVVWDTPEGRTVMHCQLIKQDGWRFHDLYIDQLRGRKIGMLLSYVKEHPILSAIQMNWDWDLFLKAFAVGFSFGGG